MTDSTRGVARRIKQGVISIDFESSALVVNFDMEMVRVDGNGRINEVIESKPDSRRIKIKSISPDRNLAEMANEIVEKCKYIHPSRAEEVEQLLIQLAKSARQEAPSSINNGSNSSNQVSSGRSAAGNQQSRRIRDTEESSDGLPPADMGQLDEYLELLYQVSGKSENENDEGIKAQIRGTAMIMKLCRQVINLEILIQNGTLMGALTRVLQDEFKKSLELTFNILRIFLSFSNFMEMHQLMAQYKIGNLTMKVIDFEFKRMEHRELEKRQTLAANEQELADIRHLSASEVPKVVERQKHAMEKTNSKSAKLQKRQEKLLFVALYILINLAEDSVVERKMVRKDIMDLLMLAIGCTSADLLVLTVTFLKRLSIVEENKDSLKERNIVSKLSRFLPCSSQPLVSVSLRLLFNLSFDPEIRDQAIQQGLVPKLVNLLKTSVFRSRTLKLLYHLSSEDRCKSMFTYTDGIPLLMGMVINFPQNRIANELAGLVVNLSLNARNAELMAGNKGLNLLVDRVVTTKDPLLMKIIRNISQWTFATQQSMENPELTYKSRGLWSPHVKNICKLAIECDNHDMLVEILGTLANLTVLDLPANQGWAKILQDFHLLSLISKILVPGMAQNDVLLEVILLLSTAATDPAAAGVIASSSILGLLYGMWNDKSSDTEMLLQLINCFFVFLQQDSSQEEVLYGTRVVVEVMTALNHRNAAVRSVADQMLDLVGELDRDKVTGELGLLGIQIRKKRFDAYNCKWLAEVSAEDGLQVGNGMGMGGGGLKAVMGGYHDEEDDEGGGMRMVPGGEDDEDIAWRSLMHHKNGQNTSHRSDNAYIGNDSPLSSNDEESWEGKRGHK